LYSIGRKLLGAGKVFGGGPRLSRAR
jgi:hypothetical protein